jgi:hypothetical protein
VIKVDEKIVGLWYVSLPGQDWLAGVRELIPNEKYELVYRFRYYKDDKVFESDDRKSWYAGELSGTRHFIVAGLRSLSRGIAEMGATDSTHHELLNESGDLAEFQRRLQDAPYMYARMETGVKP